MRIECPISVLTLHSSDITSANCFILRESGEPAANDVIVLTSRFLSVRASSALLDWIFANSRPDAACLDSSVQISNQLEHWYLVVGSVYAITGRSSREAKDEFYMDLPRVNEGRRREGHWCCSTDVLAVWKINLSVGPGGYGACYIEKEGVLWHQRIELTPSNPFAWLTGLHTNMKQERLTLDVESNTATNTIRHSSPGTGIRLDANAPHALREYESSPDPQLNAECET